MPDTKRKPEQEKRTRVKRRYPRRVLLRDFEESLKR